MLTPTAWGGCSYNEETGAKYARRGDLGYELMQCRGGNARSRQGIGHASAGVPGRGRTRLSSGAHSHADRLCRGLCWRSVQAVGAATVAGHISCWCRAATMCLHDVGRHQRLALPRDLADRIRFLLLCAVAGARVAVVRHSVCHTVYPVDRVVCVSCAKANLRCNTHLL